MGRWLGMMLFAVAGLATPASGQSSDEQQVEQALSALQPSTQVAGRAYSPRALMEMMRQQSVPGVSIVVFREGRIVYARGFGVAEIGDARPITPDTLFQAASISKPVTATGALALTEQGALDLDRPIDEQLRSWRVPESAAAEGQAVTLRHLLTHTAGLTVHGFPGYELGAELPTVPQILDGVAPANSEPVRIDQRPGSAWRYSGGGYTVAQLLMTDVAGEPFPELMRRLVLAPAGMDDSTFEQPLPGELGPQAAIGHRGDGTAVAGGYHVYPEMAAAGLWTTPSDLARWAISLAAALKGEGQLLSRETMLAMLTPGIGGWGLGASVNGSGEWLSLSHNGANEGYRANLVIYPNRGEGIVIMTNSDGGDVLFGPIMIGIARAFGWPGSEPRIIVPVAVPDDELAAAAGRYSGFGQTVEVRVEGGVLRATIAGGPPPFEVIPQGADRYVTENGVPIQFVRDADSNRVTGLVAGGATMPRTGDAP